MRIKTPLVYLLLAAAASAAIAAPMPDRELEALLYGEFALQAGDSGTAAQAYLRAAQVSRDPALAERAAQVALLADDAVTAQRAVLRWRELAPDADGLPAVAAGPRGPRDPVAAGTPPVRDCVRLRDGA